MLWWIGAAVLIVMSLPCAFVLGARVTRGEANVWSMQVLPWAIGCHGMLGFGALYMVMRAVA